MVIQRYTKPKIKLDQNQFETKKGRLCYWALCMGLDLVLALVPGPGLGPWSPGLVPHLGPWVAGLIPCFLIKSTR